ncbi:hypothetical protein [Halobaculum sp. MBLA0143]|uniref:hypothetical protein n=1 Tax=Halobaculum sp. MBLA0143 TaxID=3079933 RepID=UPI003524BCA9
MTADGPSRRRLLGALTAAAGTGFLGATGVYATLSDREVVGGNVFTSGSLGLAVGAATADGEPPAPPTTFEDGQTLSVSFDDLTPGDTGGVTAAGQVSGGAARLWLTATTPSTRLADQLVVSVASRVPCSATATTAIYDGSLSGLGAALGDGVRLTTTESDDCLDGVAGCVELSWSLPSDASVDGGTAAATLQFGARQCRHTTPRPVGWSP